MKKDALFFLTGGIAYPIIEIMWRGHSHISMAFAGGASLLCINRLCCEKLRKSRLFVKCFAGSGIITGIEFIVGILVNKVLMLGVWDYSALPYNLAGQICLPFSIIWFFLTIPATMLCDKLSYWMDNGRKKTIKDPREAES